MGSEYGPGITHPALFLASFQVLPRGAFFIFPRQVSSTIISPVATPMEISLSLLTYTTELRPWGTNDTPKSKEYWFAYNLTNYISPNDYKAILSNNITAGKLLSRFYIDNHMQQIKQDLARGYPEKLYPKNKQEEDLVRQYMDILSQIKRLPDVYINNQSFRWMGDYENRLAWVFVNTNEEKECNEVRQNVEHLFKDYTDSGQPQKVAD